MGPCYEGRLPKKVAFNQPLQRNSLPEVHNSPLRSPSESAERRKSFLLGRQRQWSSLSTGFLPQKSGTVMGFFVLTYISQQSLQHPNSRTNCPFVAPPANSSILSPVVLQPF